MFFFDDDLSGSTSNLRALDAVGFAFRVSFDFIDTNVDTFCLFLALPFLDLFLAGSSSFSSSSFNSLLLRLTMGAGFPDILQTFPIDHNIISLGSCRRETRIYMECCAPSIISSSEDFEPSEPPFSPAKPPDRSNRGTDPLEPLVAALEISSILSFSASCSVVPVPSSAVDSMIPVVLGFEDFSDFEDCSGLKANVDCCGLNFGP